jgi:CMP-N-acetylneuraminic acid synthetase
MTITCVIPARGGSKGILRKNLQLVGGVPLIDRAISTVAESGVADHIVVSTDDSEIASRATALGATYLSRPNELSSDSATSEDVLIHALDKLGVTTGDMLFVQTTTPLLEAADLRNLQQSHIGCDSSLTVTEWHGFLWRPTPDGSLTGINHNSNLRLRRQDRDHVELLENGGAYLMSISGFLRARHRFFGRIGYSLMPMLRSIEVDGPDDLALVQRIYQLLYLKSVDA